MKKVLFYTSIFLLVVIIAEVIYLLTQHDNQASLNTNTNESSSIVIEDASTVTLTPTLTHIPIPSNYNPPDYILLEGKVFYLEAMDEADFVYRIKIMQPNGEAKNIQFVKSDLDIMNVTKVDSATNKKIKTTFDNIDLNDSIKIELFIDKEAQKQTVKTITNYRIDITIL